MRERERKRETEREYILSVKREWVRGTCKYYRCLNKKQRGE